MNPDRPTMLAFNLRLTRGSGVEGWHITLYDAQTGTTLRFTSLVQLDAFLHIVTHTAGGADPDGSPTARANDATFPDREPPADGR